MRITTIFNRPTIEFLSVASPKVLAGVCTFVLNVLLMRDFGVEQFGIFALCSTVILLSDTILGSSLDLAVLRLAPLEHERDKPLCLAIQKTGLLLKAGMGMLFCLGIALCALNMGLLHGKDGSRLLFATCAAIIALLLLRSAQVHAQVAQRFFLFGLLDFLHLTVKFGGIAALVLAGRVSPPLVLLLFALGPLSGFVLWRATAGREFTKALNGQHLQLTARLWHYGRWFLITFGLAALVSRLDIFLLSKWSTLSEVGIFSAGQVIAWVPVLIGTYLAVVLTPRIMPLAREGRFNAFYRKFQPPLLGACVLGYLLSLAAIPLIGPRLLPRSFMRSMPVISVLLPGALAGLATFPLTLSFVMFVRPKFLFFMDCISLPILMLLFFCVIPRYGAVGAAWVTSAANMIRAMVAQWMAWQWAQEIDITSSKRLPLEVMD
jgi:O-antigen/teichoic acid export membrane protein